MALEGATLSTGANSTQVDREVGILATRTMSTLQLVPARLVVPFVFDLSL